MAIPLKEGGALPAWTRYFHLFEYAAFGLVCLTVIMLHVALYQNSGAFWRDECSSILLADAPSWTEMWNGLPTDSFPALFVSLLRSWKLAGLGASDSGVRLLGILFSLGIMISVVWSCRSLGVKVPLLAVSLVCLNSSMLYYGSSIRAYGLAALLIVACFAVFWKLILRPGYGNCALAFFLATLSIHCNYQNCYLLFGIGTAAALISLRNRFWKRGIVVLAICGMAASTMGIYYQVILRTQREVVSISHFQLSLATIAKGLGDTTSGGNLIVLAGWIALGVFLLVIASVAHGQSQRSTPKRWPPSPALYGVLAVVISALAGATFFKIHGMFPFNWHYLPFVALFGVAIDCGIQPSKASEWWIAPSKVAVACLLAGVSIMPAWNAAQLRRSNIDLIAATLERDATANDLILVNPFWLRPSFKKYYQGETRWYRIPVDPNEMGGAWQPGVGSSIRTMMSCENSIRPTLALARETLRKGGRLWVVGGVQFLAPNEELPDLPPAPHPRYGWDNNVYTMLWSMHLGHFLQRHSTTANSIALPVPNQVDSRENLPLIVIEGWRE